MNYTIFNIVFLCCLSLAVINPDHVTASMQYVERNWEGITQTGYEKIFGARTGPLERINALSSALNNF